MELSVAVPGVTMRTISRRTSPFAAAGILDLIADGHAQPVADQLGDVAVGGVIRHAAHRRLVLLPLVARGQDEVEQRRRLLRVLEKHLVEIAEAVEEDGVGNLALDLEVLLEHRGEFAGGTCGAQFTVRTSWGSGLET